MVLSCAVACGKEDSSPIAPSPPLPPSVFRASGTVVEIQGGPVADASVSAARCGSGAPQDIDIFARALTDASGSFVLTEDAGAVAPSGCIALRIEKEGYVPFWQSGQMNMNGITIRLQRLRRVTGRVVEVDGGPLSRVEVSYAPNRSAPTFTNETGFFALNDVGGYLTFRKSGYVQRGVTIPEGQDIDLGVVNVQPTIVVSGSSSLVSRISSADVDYDISCSSGRDLHRRRRSCR
jgi:hypothetical protein